MTYARSCPECRGDMLVVGADEESPVLSCTECGYTVDALLARLMMESIRQKEAEEAA